MVSLTNDLYIPERRCGLDRRKGKLFIPSTHWLTGKRETARRGEDRQKPYKIDIYSSKVFAAILVVILLSVLDAMLTLLLMSHGAVEINPVMAYFLSHGAIVFFGVKYLLTCTCLILVLLNKNAYLFGTKMRAKTLFVLFVIPFALVVHWELFLIFFVV
jgi:hypothetical protein